MSVKDNHHTINIDLTVSKDTLSCSD